MAFYLRLWRKEMRQNNHTAIVRIDDVTTRRGNSVSSGNASLRACIIVTWHTVKIHDYPDKHSVKFIFFHKLYCKKLTILIRLLTLFWYSSVNVRYVINNVKIWQKFVEFKRTFSSTYNRHKIHYKQKIIFTIFFCKNCLYFFFLNLYCKQLTFL